MPCAHYPRPRNGRIDFGSPSWSFPGKEQLRTARVETKQKKTVHFADTKGLNLTSTFFFLRDNHRPLPENRRKIFANFYQSNDDGDSNRTVKGQQAKLLNFKSPVPNASQQECLERNYVCLEKTLCNRSGIYGRVKVKNLALEKEVCIRYSWDSWKNFEDTQANYIAGSSTVETDTFFFHVTPPAGTTENRKVEFAICYKVNEGFYWDNNFGDNYRLVYFSC